VPHVIPDPDPVGANGTLLEWHPGVAVPSIGVNGQPKFTVCPWYVYVLSTPLTKSTGFKMSMMPFLVGTYPSAYLFGGTPAYTPLRAGVVPTNAFTLRGVAGPPTGKGR
jgi:hypothetical protein